MKTQKSTDINSPSDEMILQIVPNSLFFGIVKSSISSGRNPYRRFPDCPCVNPIQVVSIFKCLKLVHSQIKRFYLPIMTIALKSALPVLCSFNQQKRGHGRLSKRLIATFCSFEHKRIQY